MSDTAIAAYWRFFETFNTRDAFAFSSAMSYPHVRVSWAREAGVLADREAHALSVSWDAFIAAGWHHTEGSSPRVVGTTENKAHISGGWTRITNEGKKLLVNRVCYIVTCIDGRWGIQSRFGTDPGNDGAEQPPAAQSRAKSVVENFLQALTHSDVEAAATCTCEEVVVVGVGAVRRCKRGTAFPQRGFESPRVEVVQSGPLSMTINAVERGNTALIYVVRSDYAWQIRAGSWL